MANPYEMELDVQLFQFQKRLNSTLRPTQAPYWKGKVSMYESTSMTAPTLIFAPATIPPEHKTYYVFEDCNYVYINTFNRYYWITNWTRNEGLWVATTTEDILGSFRGSILNSTQYVERSTKDPNYFILDTFYPYTLDNFTTAEGVTTENRGNWHWHAPENFGKTDKNFYINMSAIGYNTEERYDEQNHAVKNGFSTYAFSNDNQQWFDRQLRSGDSKKVSFVNYVKRAFYLPVAPYVIENSANDGLTAKKAIIYYGSPWDAAKANYDIDADKGYGTTFGTFPGATESLGPGKLFGGLDMVPLVQFPKAHCSWVITLPELIQNTKKTYQKSGMYTKYYLRFLPFGTIELDPDAILSKKGSITINCEIDMNTGDATLSMLKGTVSVPLAQANVSIDVQLNSTISNESEHRRSTTSGLISMAATGAMFAMQAYQAYQGRPIANYGQTTNAPIRLSSPGGNEAATQYAAEQASWAQTKNALIGSGISAAGSIAATANAINVPVQYSSSMQGLPGSALIDEKPILFVHQYQLVDEDIERFGAMTMRSHKLNDLVDGYVQCRDAKITNESILLSEQSSIEQMLNTGIYLE